MRAGRRQQGWRHVKDAILSVDKCSLRVVSIWNEPLIKARVVLGFGGVAVLASQQEIGPRGFERIVCDDAFRLDVFDLSAVVQQSFAVRTVLSDPRSQPISGLAVRLAVGISQSL